ncbi:MAG: PAS domain-containing protein [Anaerolineales bacterium]
MSKVEHEQLSEWRTKFQQVLAHFPFPLLVLDQLGSAIYVNPRFLELFEYTEEEILQGTSWIERAFPAADRRRRFKFWLRQALHSPTSGAFSLPTCDLHCGRGGVRTVDLQVVPMGEEEYLLIGEDITREKAAWQALNESEATNRALLKAIPDPLFHLTADGTILDFVAARDFKLPVKREQMVGKSLQEVLPSEPAHKIAEGLARALETQDTQTYEYSVVQGGQRRYYEVRMVASGGNEVLALMRDITELQQVMDLLRENEARYRSLIYDVLDHAAVGIFLLEADRRIIWMNSTLERYLGLPREKVVGKDKREVIEAYLRGILEDPLSYLTASRAAYEASFPIEGLECHVLPGEGREERWLEYWSQPIALGLYAGGRIEQYTDITTRKVGEAALEKLLADLTRRTLQLETAVEVAKSASTVLDPDALMQRAVHLLQEQFNFYYVGIFTLDEPGEYALLRAGTGEAGRRLLQEGHKLAVGGKSMIGRAVATGEARIADDVGGETIRFDNPYLPQTRSEVALPLMVRGRIVGALSVQSIQQSAFSTEEVTVLQAIVDQLAVALENAHLFEAAQREIERRRVVEVQIRQLNEDLERRVRERTAQLEVSNQELEAFAYSVSHDLRAPLRSINGFSQALIEDCGISLEGICVDYLNRIRTASQRMGELIDDLLHLSRLTRSEMHRTEVNLSTLVSDVVEELRQMEPERQVELTVEPHVRVEGDPRLLRVALENLLSNAWKFTCEREVAEVSFGVTELEGQAVCFVKDNGAGFNMEYADKLFTAFQRLHATAEFEGTGIGLATVQRIIHRHGGRIWAEGEVDKGATFYFTLA